MCIPWALLSHSHCWYILDVPNANTVITVISSNLNIELTTYSFLYLQNNCTQKIEVFFFFFFFALQNIFE